MKMSWSTNVSGQMILYIQESESSGWKPYYTYPRYEPDYDIDKGSKGWATYQKLRKLGWELVSDFKQKRTEKDV
jgi:hypothetical protein